MSIDVKRLEDILISTERKLLDGHEDYLWMPSKRESAVTLVAHVDTVFKGRLRKNNIKLNGDIMRSNHKKRGLGGDDRAGVYICHVLAEKLDCNIILTDMEEVGCIGSMELAQNTKLCSEINKRSLCLVGVDRMGVGEVVSYDDCGESDNLLTLFECMGFTKNQGSFSDVTVLAPAIRLQAVNVSAGYWNEHTTREYISLPAMEHTITALGSIIKNIHKVGTPYVRHSLHFENLFGDHHIPPRRRGKRGKVERSKYAIINAWELAQGDMVELYPDEWYIVDNVDIRVGNVRVTCLDQDGVEVCGHFDIEGGVRVIEDW